MINTDSAWKSQCMSVLRRLLFGFAAMGGNFPSVTASNALPGRSEPLKVSIIFILLTFNYLILILSTLLLYK